MAGFVYPPPITNVVLLVIMTEHTNQEHKQHGKIRYYNLLNSLALFIAGVVIYTSAYVSTFSGTIGQEPALASYVGGVLGGIIPFLIIATIPALIGSAFLQGEYWKKFFFISAVIFAVLSCFFSYGLLTQPNTQSSHLDQPELHQITNEQEEETSRRTV